MKKRDYPIIDAHAHIFPDRIADKSREFVSDYYQLPMYTTGTLSELLNVRKRTPIKKQLICSPACTASQTKSINTFIAETCKKYEGLIGYGTLHKDNRDYAEEITRIKEMGLKGIKFHSDFQKFDIDDIDIIPIYKEIARQGLPILLHMGGYMHWEEAYSLPVVPNLYFDCSSALAFIKEDYMFRMIERFGEQHFFFGTDFPMWQPEEEIERLESLGLGEKIERMLLYDNFECFMNR